MNRLSGKLIHIPLLRKFFSDFSDSFIFELQPSSGGIRPNNKKRIIPCIIDFFVSDEKLSEFVKRYNKNDLVCISNKEVYDKLKFYKKKNLKLNIYHLPLSLPDQYMINPSFLKEKKYDAVLMGRQNPILLSYLERYAKENDKFIYVYRKTEQDNQGNKIFNYYTNRGEMIGEVKTRKEYMNLTRMGKVGLYSTPGMDGGEVRTQGYNQVTPRFLELVGAGCHILARYPDNSDTQFYELAKFSPSIENYDLFKSLMDEALRSEIDLEFYKNYLTKHLTSQRANQLLNKLQNE